MDPKNKTLLSTEIHFKNKLNGTPQKQLPVPINHLKEEPSAPQSLSIFDSTTNRAQNAQQATASCRDCHLRVKRKIILQEG